MNRKEAISIVGPRQTGKTTFIDFIGKEMEKQGKKVKIVTFENRADLNLFNGNIEDFKSIVKQYD